MLFKKQTGNKDNKTEPMLRNEATVGTLVYTLSFAV